MSNQPLYKLKASAKKLAIKIKEAYTADAWVSKDTAFECNAFCVLISEDAYSKPYCPDHPAIKKQSTSTLRGGCLSPAEEDYEEASEHEGEDDLMYTSTKINDEVEQIKNTTGGSFGSLRTSTESIFSIPSSPCESIFSIASTTSSSSEVSYFSDKIIIQSPKNEEAPTKEVEQYTRPTLTHQPAYTKSDIWSLFGNDDEEATDEEEMDEMWPETSEDELEDYFGCKAVKEIKCRWMVVVEKRE